MATRGRKEKQGRLERGWLMGTIIYTGGVISSTLQHRGMPTVDNDFLYLKTAKRENFDY